LRQFVSQADARSGGSDRGQDCAASMLIAIAGSFGAECGPAEMAAGRQGSTGPPDSAVSANSLALMLSMRSQGVGQRGTTWSCAVRAAPCPPCRR